MKKLIALFTIILILAGCSSTKKTSDFSNNKIIFGYGGGFTGGQTTYALDYSGNIFKENSITGASSFITKLRRKETKKIYRKFLQLGLDSLDFNQPGNLSKFIGFKSQDKIHKIIWSDESKVPENVKEFYDMLIQKVSNN